MPENEQDEQPNQKTVYKIWIGSVDPVTGEETLTDRPAFGKVFMNTADGLIEIKKTHFAELLKAFTFTIKPPYYHLFWRNQWLRGETKAIRISPVPTGNPRDN